VNRAVFGDDILYLKENMTIQLNTYNGEIIDYTLPATMEYKVVEAEAAIAGDTANNPTKKVTLETGLVISVPMFVNVDDVVKINIDEGTYISRV
jgi:elongation factor P